MRRSGINTCGVIALLAAGVGLASARGQTPSPSPPLPQQNMPALSPAPTERSVPPAAEPQISPLDGHVAPPNAPQPQLSRAEDSKVEPQREGVTGLRPNVLGFLGPYRRPTVPPLRGDHSPARPRGEQPLDLLVSRMPAVSRAMTSAGRSH